MATARRAAVGKRSSKTTRPRPPSIASAFDAVVRRIGPSVLAELGVRIAALRRGMLSIRPAENARAYLPAEGDPRDELWAVRGLLAVSVLRDAGFTKGKAPSEVPPDGSLVVREGQSPIPLVLSDLSSGRQLLVEGTLVVAGNVRAIRGIRIAEGGCLVVGGDLEAARYVVGSGTLAVGGNVRTELVILPTTGHLTLLGDLDARIVAGAPRGGRIFGEMDAEIARISGLIVGRHASRPSRTMEDVLASALAAELPRSSTDATLATWLLEKATKAEPIVRGLKMRPLAASARRRIPADVVAALDGGDDGVRAEGLDALEAFLWAGGDVNARAPDGFRPIMYATRVGRRALVETLLAMGADPRAGMSGGYDALMTAAGEADVELTRCLLAAGADAKAQSKSGRTALHEAADAGRLASLELLLEAGADVAARTRDGETALVLAADRGHEACVRVLIRSGASARRRDGRTALSSGAYNGHAGVVRALLEGGAEVDARSKSGGTPLMTAAARGHAEVAAALIDAQADVGAVDKVDASVLMRAALHGHAGVVELLLRSGADASYRMPTGDSALDWARSGKDDNAGAWPSREGDFDATIALLT